MSEEHFLILQEAPRPFILSPIMKHILLIFFLFVSTLAHAQWSDNNFIYMKGEASGGNYFGVRLGLHYIHKDKYALQLSYSSFIRIANSLPKGYGGGIFSLFTFGATTPLDQIDSYELLAGKVMQLDGDEKLRLQLKSGLAYSFITEPINWQKQSSFFGFAPNYTYEDSRKDLLSIVLNPSLEYALSRYFGIGLSAYAILNRETIAVGMGGSMMIGILRGKNKPVQF